MQAQRELDEKISSGICFGRAREIGISVYDIEPWRFMAADLRSMRYVSVSPFACNSTGKQTGNYLKRVRPEIRVCGFARIIPRALKSKQPYKLANWSGTAPPFRPRYFAERYTGTRLSKNSNLLKSILCGRGSCPAMNSASFG